MGSEELDTPRHYENILELQIEEGLAELERPAFGQFLSALSCGLNLGISVFGLLAVTTVLGSVMGEGVTHLVKSLVYTFGFVLTIMAQTELFTEHTTLAVLPVLDGEAGLGDLGQLWGLVYAGNIVGGALFAGFLVVAGPELHLVDTAAFVSTARTFIDLSTVGVFTGAILAGWLMGLLSWVLTSVRDSVSRILVIVVCTFPIGFGHLPHCVAGNIEVVAGMLAGADVSLAQWAQFLGVTTVGNVVGGVVFVTLLNYSHVVYGTEGEDAAITD
ncbi:formate/nitrite transporter family protein [Halomarina litorea]|uniref:formate/nitrite transporter family protein n=1 Tax=Halomarina litorea TaxID=2961595 RepID=UPI0020C3E4A5|nr:formate/nitrite transporter family protein [Halomarina sp. BCD28]